jgi:hypothetical protein
MGAIIETPEETKERLGEDFGITCVDVQALNPVLVGMEPTRLSYQTFVWAAISV